MYVRKGGGGEGHCLFAEVLDSSFATVPGAQYRVITVCFSFFGRLVLVDGFAIECPSLGKSSSLTLSYECHRSVLIDSPSS